MSTDQWLRGFLDAQNLSKPDGRPLYAYRCDDEQFRRLREALSALPFREVARALPREGCAGFCLYAAEWWRRNHEGGAWSWSGLLRDLGWATAELPALYPIVQEGLVGFWKRQLLSLGARRAFLVTLACEGGLPLRLLHREETSLRRYYHDLLHEFALFARSGRAASELAARVGDRLPRSLRQEVVYELSGRLTSEIWELQLAVGESRNPVETLDRQSPGWRDHLPLRVEDDTARILLNNLVEDAARIASRRVDGFSLARRLRRIGTDWNLEAELRFPGRIGSRDVAAMLDLRSDASLPPRLHVHLEEDGGASSYFAMLTQVGRGDGEGAFVVEVPPRTVTRFDSLRAVPGRLLTARTQNEECGQIEVNGGGALTDLPWVFAESAADPEVLDFLGQGSVRARHPALMVTLGPSWQPEGETSEIVQRVGEIPGLERSLWRLCGAMVFADDDGNRCRIESGAAAEETGEFRLEGKTSPYGSRTVPLFLGPPTVSQRRSGTGVRENVAPSSLEWRPVGVRDWRPLGADCLGDVVLRVMSEGESKFTARAGVLPAQTEIELLPGRHDQKGCVRLRHTKIRTLRAVPLENIEYEPKQPERGVVELEVSILKGEPPATLVLLLVWDEQRKLKLELPVPVRLGRFLGREGNALKREAEVCVDQLSGVVATVVDAEENGRFVLEGKLLVDDLPPDTAQRLAVHQPLLTVDSRRHLLDLQKVEASVRSGFALSDDLDAVYSLRIVGESSDLPPRPLNVRRYDLKFELDREGGEVSLEGGSRSSGPSEADRLLRVEARPLWRGDLETVVLPSTGEGRWHFDSESFAPGPWLILGWEGNWCRARPTLWPVPGDAASEDGKLAEAARVGPEPLRAEAMDHVLGAMASNVDDPEWERFFGLLDAFEGVPKSALHLFDRLIRNPDALAMALLLADANRFDRLWYALDELPFAWDLLPVRSWLAAARCLASALEAHKLPSQMVALQFETFLTRAPARRFMLGPIAELIEREVLRREPKIADGTWLAQSDSDRRQREKDLREQQKDVRRAFANERWPTGPDLAELRGELPSLPGRFEQLWEDPPPPLRFQSSLLNAPVFVALAAALGVPLDRARVCELARLRDSAPDYFDRAGAQASAWVLGYLWEKEPRRFE